MKKGYEKRFNPGDIVYWCGYTPNGHYYVKWGMVDEQFSDAVCVDFLERKENRYIDGIPLDEFIENQNRQKRKKLPKGWTYNTELFKLEYITDPEDEKKWNELNVSESDPESIKKAYDLGLLVKSETKFHGEIHANITNEGYIITAKYPMWTDVITHTSIRPDRVYSTYKEAKDEVDSCTAKLHQQAEMSDYDWAVREIDDTLDYWQYISGATDEEKNAYREWILAMDDVENIEVRTFGGYLQWKYFDKKRWNNITL